MGSAKKRIQYTYDALGNRSVMVDPDTGRFTYAYDSLRRITCATNPQNERTSYSYDANNRRTVKRLANGTRASFTYDDANRLTALGNLKSDGSVISQFDYSYDAAGNRTAVLEADGSRTTWLYDDTDQLTGEHRTGTNAYRNTFTYDPAGNRALKNEGGTRTTYAYDNANQLRYGETIGGRTTYTFDADGNQQLVTEPSGDRTTTTWDYENRTTLVELPSSVRNTMAYEPDGLRVKLADSAGTKKFIWDNQNYLAEADSNNDTQVVYNNEPAFYGNLISQRRATTTNWFHFDALGSTSELTDPSENVSDTYLYDAWGNVISSTGSTVNPFQWTGSVGYYFDSVLGTFYIRARAYSPVIGRWLSVDPLGFVGGVNLYLAYFVPNGVDPSGMLYERELAWCEFCLFKIMEKIFPVASSFGTTGLFHVKVTIHNEITDPIPGGNVYRDILTSRLLDTSLKRAFADITFLNGQSTAITLGKEIHTLSFNKGCGECVDKSCHCKNKVFEREGAITDIEDAALIAHELLHVAQQHSAGENNFYRNYLQEYAALVARGLTGQQAYKCISSEREAYALEETLETFFADAKRLATFNCACCKDEDIPAQHLNIIRAGYQRRLTESTILCNRLP